jgi:mannan endo-1,4-beta-mannosidase
MKRAPGIVALLAAALWEAVAAAGGATNAAPALAAADPDLIPEAREILLYLHEVRGKGVLLGQNYGRGPAERVHELSGKWPALVGYDLSGHRWPRWTAEYRGVLQASIDSARAWWTEHGGIVQFQWHWFNPLAANATWKHEPPVDLRRAVAPGTAEHEAVMRDLSRTADYLRQLADARVPVFFRPLHEIDGGWFWWTDCEHGENTAALWRMLFDYLVKERGLHNLIWVYSVGQGCGGKARGETSPARYAFYPGDAYVDIVGIDVYAGGQLDHKRNGWALFYGSMSTLFPGKLVALTECPAVPNPDEMRAEAAFWSYAMAWWAPGKGNPEEWVKTVAPHEFIVTLDEIPDFRKGRKERGR